MKQTKKILSAKRNLPAITPLKTVDEVTADYVAGRLAQKNIKDDGQDCSLRDLRMVAERLVAIHQNHTFSFETFANLALFLDLDFQTVERFWIGWVRAQRDAGKIRQIESCYDGILLAFN